MKTGNMKFGNEENYGNTGRFQGGYERLCQKEIY